MIVREVEQRRVDGRGHDGVDQTRKRQLPIPPSLLVLARELGHEVAHRPVVPPKEPKDARRPRPCDRLLQLRPVLRVVAQTRHRDRDLGGLAGHGFPAIGHRLPSREAGVSRRLGRDPGRVRLDRSALQRPGQLGCQASLALDVDRGPPCLRVDPVHLLEPAGGGRVELVPISRAVASGSEADVGLFLGRPDEPRVGPSLGFLGPDEVLVVGAPRFAERGRGSLRRSACPLGDRAAILGDRDQRATGVI